MAHTFEHLTLDYQNDQLLVDGTPLGVPLSKLRTHLVYDSDDQVGVVRVFLGAAAVTTVPKKTLPLPPREPDLVESLSEADAFEVAFEQARRGVGRGR
ncbi:hypothetical protein SEA_GHOBES_8 [Gordonia phage Ghobes]|uniref:Uncharacterized protein n=1 Tax=Gordonia phage Ghobes TaxID=1887647 RepID=A0A1B3B046_9CAUD|nr:head-tail connector protein [Gordonia phage Ghobes]AOE44361.1 hypothetical protein SEA_GHOBES_8 [Gordonia phage Ghobes]